MYKIKSIQNHSPGISALADIHPDAELGFGAEVASFATIEDDVVIGEGCHIGAKATILSGVRIGRNCHIFPGAVIGAIPQDLKFRGEYTQMIIGDHTTIREYVTINRGTQAGRQTVIGDNGLIMAYTHIAHDCIIGNNVIIANATQLGGEVVVDDFANLSAAVLVHQFTRIGKHAMVQGGSKVNKDVPPYVIAGREPVSFSGINSIGLRRKGFSKEEIRFINSLYRVIYLQDMNTTQAVEHILSHFPASKIRNEVVRFITDSSRGIIRGALS